MEDGKKPVERRMYQSRMRTSSSQPKREIDLAKIEVMTAKVTSQPKPDNADITTPEAAKPNDDNNAK